MQLLIIDHDSGEELGVIPLGNKVVGQINEFGILVYERENDETAHPAFYDFNLNKKWDFEEPAQVKPIDFTSSFFVSKKLIELGGGCQLVDNSSLALIELSSGAKRWEFENAFLKSLNGKKPEIKSELGVFQDMLLLNTDDNGILELHLSSGKPNRYWGGTT